MYVPPPSAPAAAWPASFAADTGRSGRWTAVAIAFLLAAFPWSRLKFGAAPVYFVDLAILFGWLQVFTGALRATPLRGQGWFVPLFWAFAYFIVVAVANEMMQLRVAAEPLYMGVRYLLAISTALLLPILIRRWDDVPAVVAALLLGVLVNALTGVLYALPGFNGLSIFLASDSMLFPGRARIDDPLAKFAEARTDRASSFVGGANIVGTWLVVLWPLALAAWRGYLGGTRWRLYGGLVTVLAPIGGLLAYSRSTLLALIGIVLVVGWTGWLRARTTVTTLALVGVVFITGFALASSLFKFEYVFNKFAVTFDDPTAAYTDRARLLSYTEVLPFVAENPLWIVTGKGFAGQKAHRYGSVTRDQIMKFEDGEVHSVYASNTYNMGLLSTVVYHLLALTALGMAIRTRRWLVIARPERAWLPEALALGLVAMVPFWLFTHIYTNNVAGIMLVFVVFGLVLTAHALARGEALPGRPPLSPLHPVPPLRLR